MKRVLIAILVLLAWSVSSAFGADCRIVSWEAISPPGPTQDFRIMFDLGSIRTITRTTPVFDGQRAPNSGWGLYSGVSYVGGADSRIATVDIHGWIPGEDIEFSTGAMYGQTVWYTDPYCSAYKYNGHYRLKLGEKFQPKRNPAQAAINLLLQKHGPPPLPPHQCAVLSVERTATNGAYGDYKIVLSLQKFDPAAPANAVPYVDRQSAPNSAWTGWYAVQRVGDTAILTVTNWPITWSIEFSYKLVAGGVDYWQDLDSWLYTGCQLNYALTNGHFLVPLN